jgi:hypothetical protein
VGVVKRLVVGEHRDAELLGVAPHGDVDGAPGESTPVDGRMHSIDVRDAAAAFAGATTADVAGEILLIGGDESHLLRQGDVGKTLAAARGLTDVLPGGRLGDPDSDEDWFITDWMRAAAGWRRYPMRLVAPLARLVLKRRAAYRNAPGRDADPWGAIRTELGEPRADIRERVPVS